MRIGVAQVLLPKKAMENRGGNGQKREKRQQKIKILFRKGKRCKKSPKKKIRETSPSKAVDSRFHILSVEDKILYENVEKIKGLDWLDKTYNKRHRKVIKRNNQKCFDKNFYQNNMINKSHDVLGKDVKKLVIKDREASTKPLIRSHLLDYQAAESPFVWGPQLLTPRTVVSGGRGRFVIMFSRGSAQQYNSQYNCQTSPTPTTRSKNALKDPRELTIPLTEERIKVSGKISGVTYLNIRRESSIPSYWVGWCHKNKLIHFIIM